MNQTIKAFLQETVSENVEINQFNKQVFPIYLHELYDFYMLNFLSQEFVIAKLKNESFNIQQIKKHLHQIENISNYSVIFYSQIITKFRKKSFIEERISYISDQHEMFIPKLGLLMQKDNKKVQHKEKKISSSTYLVYLYFLYNKDAHVNPTFLADKFGFSKMTASRATQQLYDVGLLDFTFAGGKNRNKEYTRIGDHDYFKKSNHLITSPIKKIVYTTTKLEHKIKAGLYSLSEKTSLSEPDHLIYAMDYKSYKKQNMVVLEEIDEISKSHTIELQLLNIDPRWFASDGHVDLFTLYATLKDNNDVRIQQSLKEVLKEVSWYQD